LAINEKSGIASQAKFRLYKNLSMSKHSLLFHSSVIAMPVIGTYRVVKNQKCDDDALIFKHIDSGAFIQISSDGRLLYQRASDVDFYWTYVADIQAVIDESVWHCTFTYFDVDLLIQRVGASMKIGEYTPVENINTGVVSNFDTALL
jgi:hypothetical protein